MAGRSLVLVLVPTLLTAALAGCLAETVETDPDYAISRQVRIHLDDANWPELDDLGSTDVYDYVDSSFVVTVRKAEIAPGSLTLSYRDRTGADVDRPLSDFTTKPVLAPGDAVRIEDADIASHAVLSKNGAVVASRVISDPSWWTVQGMPLGFELDPGSKLAYDVTGGFEETATLHDVRIKEPAVHIDAMTASVHIRQSTHARLDFTGAEEVVTATTTHKARPLAWSFDGEIRLPMIFEVTGTDVEKGTAILAGVEVLPETGVAFDARGKLWFDETGRAVLGEIDGGSFATQADVIAWATGVEDAEDFSCNGKTRDDACRPTEWDLDEYAMEEQIPADRETFDDREGDVPSDVLANVTRFLAEDLQPGDEIRFDMRLTDASDMWGLADGGVLAWSAEIKAVGFEQVSVEAGTFEALKVIEQVRVDSRIPLGSDTPIDVDQTLLEATFWFEPRTFVPLRLEYVLPFNIGEVAESLIAAAGDDFWEGAPIERFDPEDLSIVTESRFALELAEKSGTARFSPWMTLVGAQYAGSAPGLMLLYPAMYAWGGHSPGVTGYAEEAPPEAFPFILLDDADPAVGPTGEGALAFLEHRGGAPLAWWSHDLQVLRNGEPASVTWADADDCAGATYYPEGEEFAVGERVYLCRASDTGGWDVEGLPALDMWQAGDELTVRFVRYDDTVVYESTTTLS